MPCRVTGTRFRSCCSVAKPGIGKSRILNTLREHLQGQGAQAPRFQCSPYHVNSALWRSVDNLERVLKGSVLVSIFLLYDRASPGLRPKIIFERLKVLRYGTVHDSI